MTKMTKDGLRLHACEAVDYGDAGLLFVDSVPESTCEEVVELLEQFHQNNPTQQAVHCHSLRKRVQKLLSSCGAKKKEVYRVLAKFVQSAQQALHEAHRSCLCQKELS